jgi:hypothetical protein
MNPLDFMDRPIAFHRVFVTITGSVNAALMLSQAIYWSKRTKDVEGWFYKSAIEWEKETGLTRREQDTARKLLAEVLEEKLAGMPATTHFRVTGGQLRKWFGNKTRPSLAENAKLDSTKAPNKFGGKRQTTNIAETTAESTKERARGQSRAAGGLEGLVDNNNAAVRIRAIFHRREATGFSPKEIKAFKRIEKKIMEDDLAMVERCYKAQWPPNRDKNILRHDPFTFLNNYETEVDRALSWCEKHSLPGARKIRIKEPLGTEIELPPPDPEAEAKFLAAFEQVHHRLPYGYERKDGEIVKTNGSHD